MTSKHQILKTQGECSNAYITSNWTAKMGRDLKEYQTKKIPIQSLGFRVTWE
jgi:hypothetical protein